MKCRRSYAGFTLLEMMLTVGFIALTATFVGLNVGSSDTKLAKLEAKRFVALLNLAQDESIISGRPIVLTVDADNHSYQFAPLDIPSIFLSDFDRDQDPAPERGTRSDDRPQVDSFFKVRHIPERVKISFSLLPDLTVQEADDKFVPKKVHELLNKSLFERRDLQFEEENAKALILVEPNGLVSPFSLSLSVDEYVSNVGLDRFGRAALLVAK